jgi:hypothetical protein
MFDKFLESQAKKMAADSRAKFEQFLTENDVDNNGEKDREQLLNDFDQFANGVQECIKSGASMAQLIAAYYNKFGPRETEVKSVSGKSA